MAVFKHLKNWTGEDKGLITKVHHESERFGGTSSYEELSDKPLINGVILQGNVELDALGIQAKGNYITVEETETRINEAIDALEIPQEYITEKDLEEKGYLTEHQDLSEYAKGTDIPTKISELENDSHYINSLPDDLATVAEVEDMIKDKADKTEVADLDRSIIEALNNKLDKSKHITVDVDDFDLTERHDEDVWYNANMCNEIFAKFDEMLKEVEDEIPSDISELKNDKNYATVADVSNAVASLVGGAPETLDTLGELATGLASNKAVIEVLNDAIELKANKKDLEGLATEEYVNQEIGKLPGESELEEFGKNIAESITKKLDKIDKVDTVDMTASHTEYQWYSANAIDNICIDFDNDLSRVKQSVPVVPTHIMNITSTEITNWNQALETIASLQDTITSLEERIAALEGGVE